MKRIVASFILMVFLLSFAACGNKNAKVGKFCLSCGENISNAVSFCGYCGVAVNDNQGGSDISTSESSNTTSSTEENQNVEKPGGTQSPTHTHKYISLVITAVTCGRDGVKAFTCSCGSSYTEKIAATGQHSWKSATCITPKTCTICCKTEGSAVGHSWGNWTTLIAAEVGITGQEMRTCSSCKQSETQSIPALKEDTTKKWFINQYNIAKQQYVVTLNSAISSKSNEISTLTGQASACYSDYLKERTRIKEQCASSGMSNSGYESRLLKNAEDNYTAKAKAYTNQISILEDEIAIISVEIASPNVDNILAIVTQNCKITSKETYDYYYKYSESLS